MAAAARRTPVLRGRGSAEAKRLEIFRAVLDGLAAQDLPSVPQPRHFEGHRIVVLEGPETWIRYFVWAEPTPKRLAAGLYVPKNRFGDAVNAILLRDRTRLQRALGGEIEQHKEVQREFRHFVSREHAFRPQDVDEGVRWCIDRIRGAADYVTSTAVLHDADELEATLRGLVAPTDDPQKFEDAVSILFAAGDTKKPTGNPTPERKSSPGGQRFVRSPAVAAYVERRARGRCEGCLAKAPFTRDDGRAFLEIHHLQRLADRGPDTPDNAVAVCPNCHRELHHGAERTAKTTQIRVRIFGA